MGLETALIALAVGGSLGGGVLQARGPQEQASSIEEAARFNQAAALQRGRAEEARIRRAGRRRLSSQRVAVAKQGVGLIGSPLDRLAQNAAELELDALNAGIEARNTAFLERQRAKSAKKIGRNRAGAALLSGTTRGAGIFLSTR